MRWHLIALFAAGCEAAAVSPPLPPPPPPRAPVAPRPAAPSADATPTQRTPAQLARDAKLAKQAAAYVDAFINRQPLLLRDGRVVFVSTRDGLPSLYIGDANKPGGPARKLATPNERVAAVALSTDERSVLFTSDVSSDGNFRVFSTDVDGSSFHELTPGESLHRDAPVPARNKTGIFAFSGHASSDRTARVFVCAAQSVREVYRDKESGHVIDFAPDGSRILFRRFVSENDHVLFEIDVAAAKATRIYPPEGSPTRLSDAKYSADGKRVFVAAAEESKPSWVVAVDPATGRAGVRYVESRIATATIEDLGVSPTGDALAIMVDAGDHSEIRVLDAKTMTLRATVASGLAAAFLGSFRADGARFGITLSTPDSPSDVFAVDPKKGAIEALRKDSRPELADLPKVTSRIEKVTAFDGLTIPVNLFLPAGAVVKRPTIVLIHGGPSGSAYMRWNPTVRFLASRGFAVVEPNIRGSSGFGIAFEKADDRDKRGDALRDVGSVHAWASGEPWCDRTRLVIMGHSYGGYMTLLALTKQPTLWRAGVDGAGMSDLKTMEQLEDQTIRACDETEFGALGKDDALLEKWSPLKDAGAIAAPLFVYQGARDPVTPQEQADRIVKAVRMRGLPVEYMLVEDEGHGFVRRDNIVVFLARVGRFLEEQLGGTLATP